MFAGKQVQKPGIEGPREVGIFVEVREKSSVKVWPVRWNADAGVIKLRAGRGINYKSGPEANQDQHKGRDLRSHPRESESEQEYVSQSDLRQRVFKRPVGLPGMQRPQKNSQEDQKQRPARSMSQHLNEALTLGFSARNRERQRRAH